MDGLPLGTAAIKVWTRKNFTGINARKELAKCVSALESVLPHQGELRQEEFD